MFKVIFYPVYVSNSTNVSLFCDLYDSKNSLKALAVPKFMFFNTIFYEGQFKIFM